MGVEPDETGVTVRRGELGVETRELGAAMGILRAGGNRTGTDVEGRVSWKTLGRVTSLVLYTPSIYCLISMVTCISYNFSDSKFFH